MFRRNAFTLVELLVVIAIIGILIALLLPAVQAAREAARRLQCKNNLKQQALGCMTHNDAHGHLPTGGWHYLTLGDPERGFGVEQPGGWMYNILPFIEYESIHELGKGLTGAARQGAFAERVRTPLSVFSCPSRRPARTYPDNHTYLYGIGPLTESGRSDYAGNFGTVDAARSGAPSSYAAEKNHAWADLSVANGIFYQRSTVRFRDITDGTSHTFAIGEKYINPDHYATGQDSGDNESLYVGDDSDILRWSGPEYWPPMRDIPGYTGYYPHRFFGSAHPSGLHFAYADGHVDYIGYDVDRRVYCRLGSRTGETPGL